MNQSRTVIVGASGVIGGALMKAARRSGRPTVGTALRRLRDGLVSFDMGGSALHTAIPDLGPGDVVFVLAGYISPAWIFANPEAARGLNLDATKRLVDEIVEAGARPVFMSSDQVFDGEEGGYVESAATRPLNLYGRLKAEAERHVLATPSGIVARTGWNVGWDQGQHCPVSQCYDSLLRPGARMAEDNVINVTDVEDTARGLLALAGTLPPAHRVYHLVSAPGISRRDLADAIRRESRWGGAMAFEPIAFASLPYSEPRPCRAFLRSERLPDLGLQFTAPAAVIRRKVALIDAWRGAAATSVA